MGEKMKGFLAVGSFMLLTALTWLGLRQLDAMNGNVVPDFDKGDSILPMGGTNSTASRGRDTVSPEPEAGARPAPPPVEQVIVAAGPEEPGSGPDLSVVGAIQGVISPPEVTTVETIEVIESPNGL